MTPGYMNGDLAAISYKPGWYLERRQEGTVILIRWGFSAPCSVNGGSPVPQWGRWWALEVNATKDAVIKTALKAALACEEHECLEHFKVHGKLVCDPHKELV